MNVVDSSGWLEYFTGGPGSRHFEAPLSETEQLIVPTLSIFEVFRRVLQQRDETTALQAVALMRRGRAVPLDEALALEAARLSVNHRLPMADSVVLATARRFDAVLWTQDADFKGLDGVRYFAKPAPRASRR